MITYVIPLSYFPDTYNKQPLLYAALAAQKNYMSLYLIGVYSHPETQYWLETEYARVDKKLNMGKSCVRFKHLDDLPLPTIGKVIGQFTPDRFIQLYQQARQSARTPKLPNQ